MIKTRLKIINPLRGLIIKGLKGITLRAITREGVTFFEDMFASRAESLSGGVKLFASRRLFKWDI